MALPVIGFICGSLRKGSINAQLTSALCARVEAAGIEVRHLDLGAYDLPIFHGDLESPAGLTQLKSDLLSCDGLIIVTPEYNGSLPALLKNAIDWVTTKGMDSFTDQIYGIAACTPGPLSGIMVLRELNYILTRIGADVVTPHVGVGNADNAFDVDGALKAQPSSDMADQMIAKLLARIATS
ncbi:MAG: NADPH-dependent FMN reductase [Maricaulaceae bacterium]